MARSAKLTAMVGFLALTIAGAGCSPSTGVNHPRGLSPELPITRVTLYQNGIAYFERQGKLVGDRLTLHCRPHQINDLLKSLTVIDRTSGRAVSISLPLEKGVVARLGRLPKQVRKTTGLLGVLRVFRGARIRIRGKQGTVSGRVIGVEQGLLRTSGKTPPTGWRVTLKSSGGQLVVYPVADIKRVQMLDRALEQGLDKSLDISLEEGTSVQELVTYLVDRYSDLAPILLDEEGGLSRKAHVFIDGRSAIYLERGLATPLRSDQRIAIFPAVAGG